MCDVILTILFLLTFVDIYILHNLIALVMRFLMDLLHDGPVFFFFVYVSFLLLSIVLNLKRGKVNIYFS